MKPKGSQPLLVSAAVIEHEGRILLARRGGQESHAGGWEFPGGKVEPGETIEQCLAREILEELSVRIAVGEQVADVVHHYPGKTIRLVAFRCTLVEGTPAPHEHEEIAWAGIGELASYDFLPADRPIVEKLEGHRPR